MSVNPYNTTNYENKSDWTLGENKPNSNPIKPNFQKAKMNANVFVTKDYGNETAFRLQESKSKQTQFQTRRRFFSTSPLVRLGTPYGGVPMTAYYTRDCRTETA